MNRGHVWTSPAFPASVQEQAILAAGVTKRALYTDDLASALKSLRAGDRLVVAGLRGLGRSREAIMVRVADVHLKGCAVMDAATKRVSTGKHCKAMVAEAVRALGNERRGPRKRTKKDRRMPWDQVARFYFDKTLSNAQVEAAVASNGYTPMTYHTMRRHFQEKRGAPVGRPSIQRAATL